jgi:hypothetical protein
MSPPSKVPAMGTTWQEHLQRQDGVLARHQAISGGMSRHEWAWKLERGLWQRAAPGIAIAHSGGTTERERAWAAVLHAGTSAAVSGDAALRLVGLGVAAGKTIDVVVPRARHVVGASLETEEKRVVVIHRVHRPERWIRELRALPVVTAHAATLQAAAWADSDRAAEWRVAAAVQARITAVSRLREALADMPTLRRRALLRSVLDDVELGAHAGSELQFLRFCRTHHLPAPDELQVRVRSGTAVHYLDARYRRQRVTVEVDGAHHKDVEVWEADALRSLRVAAELPGERMVRLTTGLLRHEGGEVAALLGTILR